ncbi:exo-alpha-sialidase [Trypanosoma cruzi]|nr:exo-alpha-sialidase [Trypanosoma cruzi]
MNGCRQEALTINMAREHAATPRRKTGEESEGKKARSSTTHTEGTNTSLGKSTATALALAGDSTPTLTHTHTISQCRQSAEEKIRPSTQQTHTPPAVIHQWTRTRSDTPPPPPVKSHGQRDTATAPKPTNIAHGASNHPKTHAEADPHPATTRRHSPRGHTESALFPQYNLCVVHPLRMLPLLMGLRTQ